MTISRSNPLPLYHQVKEWLVTQIEGGQCVPGSQVPPEAALMQEFGLSRGTIRQAVNDLVHEGRLYRVHGRGTFVSAPRVEHRMAQTLTSFAEDMREQAIPFSSHVLSRKVVKADNWIASRLHISPDENVIFLERLGHAKGEPIVVAHTYLPASSFPNLLNEEMVDCSLYQLLGTKYGVSLKKARRTLEPALADEYEARLLNIRKGALIHLMESVAYDCAGQPVEYSKLWFRGDRSRFVFEVTRETQSR